MDFSCINLILYIVAWIIVFLVFYKKKKYLSAGLLIVLSYIFYAIISFLLYVNPLAIGEFKTVTLFPFIYLFVLLFVSLRPVLRYNEKSVIRRPNLLLINIYIYIYFISTIFILPSIFSNMREGIMLLLTTPDGGEALYNASKDVTGGHSSIMGLFSAIYNIISDFGVLLLFYYCTLPKRKLYVLIGLIICPLVAIIYSLSLGLRTEASMKILTIVGGYFLLRPNIVSDLRKKISTVGLIAGSLVLFLMTILTISRFRNFTGGVLYEVERYIGQANLNFNNYCLDAGGIRYGDRTMNTFKQMLGFSNVPKDVMETRAKYSHMAIDDGSFYTFIGDFTLDFGPFFAFLLISLFTFIIYKLTIPKRKGVIYFHQLILIYFVMVVCIQGGMYLFYYSFKHNYTIIVYFISYLIFRFSNRIKVSSSHSIN